jgi:hypothetical protein
MSGNATVWPTKAYHEIVRYLRISKVLDRFEKCFWFAFHDANLARHYVNAQTRTLETVSARAFSCSLGTRCLRFLQDLLGSVQPLRSLRQGHHADAELAARMTS